MKKKPQYGISRMRTTSVVGGMASPYVNLKQPSELIPFKGDLPMLNDIDAIKFRDTIRETLSLDELSPLFQRVATEGYRIAVMEEGFIAYLRERAITPDDFVKLSNAEKSDYLLDWMNLNSLGLESLKITIRNGKSYVQ
jgi:hypothetical protein